jgi:hypothetical protein
MHACRQAGNGYLLLDNILYENVTINSRSNIKARPLSIFSRRATAKVKLGAEELNTRRVPISNGLVKRRRSIKHFDHVRHT